MNKTNRIRVTNIQRMCFHDGPGIRTTVFLKGCSLRCPWCSNPENISFEIQEYHVDGKNGIYGRDYRVDELFGEIMKDRAFWGTEGGITFSGGEPLLQANQLKPLLELLKKDGINVVVETALFVNWDNIDPIVEYVDGFIVDVKVLIPKNCKAHVGGDLMQFEENVKRLYEKRKISVFRIPCSNEYTLIDENRKQIQCFVKEYPNIPVQIFKIHNLGEAKYASLGMKAHDFENVDDERMDLFAMELKSLGADVLIISL